MLHLIWSKDNNSSSAGATAAAAAMAGDDGKDLNLKGVRARLLECYRSLYFDPLPDMEPRQQVNRIAKNMIELRCLPLFINPDLIFTQMLLLYPRLTYDATLAELTSLEEMMRSMMDDGQIHPDVIAKLWQVYSGSLVI